MASSGGSRNESLLSPGPLGMSEMALGPGKGRGSGLERAKETEKVRSADA